eukprot:170215_1
MAAFLLLWLCVNIVSYTGFAEEESNEHVTITQISRSLNEEDSHLSINILTAIQNDFYKLSQPQIVSFPDDNPKNLNFMIQADDDNDNQCIHSGQAQSQCCYQSFTILSTTDNEDCKLYLQGSFEIEFNIECNAQSPDPMLLDKCAEYVQSNGDKTTLEVRITHADSICNQKVFNVDDQSTHTMRFFKDAEYTYQMSETELYEPYDKCYAEIEIHHASSYNVGMYLQNVWLCSRPPTEDIFSGEGCFDEDVDDDNGPFWIIKNHETEPSLFGAHIISETNDKHNGKTVIHYVFEVPAMHRDTLYIHNQISIDIDDEDAQQRTTMIWAVFGHVRVRNVFIPYYDLYRNVKFVDDGTGWVVFLGIWTALLLLCMIVMVVFKIFGIDGHTEYETDVMNDDFIRKPMVRKRRIRINNKEFMQYEDVRNEQDEDDSEYMDLEHDHDPLDQSY